MKKTSTLLLALLLMLAGTACALAEAPDPLSSTATLSFDANGTLSVVNPAADDGFGRTFTKMDIPFGLNEIPLFVQDYDAKAPETEGSTTYGIIVADGRGEDDPSWNLKARLNTVFEHSSGESEAAFNATIALNNGTASSSSTGNVPTVQSEIGLLTAGSDTLVMEGDGLGVGGFYAEWAPEDITLTLGTDFGNIRKGDYTAEIVWTVAPGLDAEDVEEP